ncbi:hypothetical protein [Mammaliicoccus sciuri]|uniref:hypothetical protein n=1 Tax=Mammaliicoccus sciuri TaxID=1296 RepID=UPI0019596429|nr:hypothetical protein [Mammaliicoccus sciuri]
MVRTSIVKYDKNKHSTFEQQINYVLEDIQTKHFIYIIDVKVLSETKVLIIYRESM